LDNIQQIYDYIERFFNELGIALEKIFITNLAHHIYDLFGDLWNLFADNIDEILQSISLSFS
jgi:hypothetical protein